MKHKTIWIYIIGIYLGLSAQNLGLAFNIYWANLHSHTSLSDGQGTVDEAYRYARDSANIDVLAITDHTHYLTENGYLYTRNVANQFTENGRFVAIAGQEFGSLSAFGHFSVFEANSLYPYSVNGLVLFYNWINENKVLAQFNHPRTGDFNSLEYNRNGDNYATMFEIVNGSGTYTPYYEELYILALNNGWHIAPVANQDNHRKKWGNATTTQGQIPLTGIWADTLTKEKILEAMEKKRLYAVEVKPANDRMYLRDFSIGTTKMGDMYYTTDKNVSIKIHIEAINNFSNIIIYKNSIIYKDSVFNTNVINWSFNDTITNGYYFIKGIQQDGDRFWTAPIWVNYKPGPTSIEAWPNPIRNRSKIEFPAEIEGLSELFIYNLEGKLVYKEQKEFEKHFWDGTDQNGKILENGIYFVVVKVKAIAGPPEQTIREKIYKGKIALLRQ